MRVLLLSCFSRVWLCATPETAAHQAPPSLGFSRQEHWSELPFPSPMHESEKWKWSRSGVSDSSKPHGLQPTRLLHPWDFPGKSTGVGCHCLLWRVLQTYIFFFCCVTWSTHSLSRDQTHTPCIECRPLTTEAPDKSIVIAVLMTNFLYAFTEFCAMLKLLELCLTLDCSALGSSVPGVFQARILEWAAMTLAGDLPNPGIKPIPLQSPALAHRFFTSSATWEACWVLRGLHILKIQVLHQMLFFFWKTCLLS